MCYAENENRNILASVTGPYPNSVSPAHAGMHTALTEQIKPVMTTASQWRRCRQAGARPVRQQPQPRGPQLRIQKTDFVPHPDVHPRSQQSEIPGEGCARLRTRLEVARGHVFLHPTARFLSPNGDTLTEGRSQA